MPEPIEELFSEPKIVNKIKSRLPYLFRIAELESSRAGKIGMQVGSLREKILVALLIYKFGEESVQSDIPITEREVDVILSKKPISIKTCSSRTFSGVKLIWTVDAQSVANFATDYYPSCDMLFVHINWENEGGFYLFPTEVQREVFDEVGRDSYIKILREGTNNRGVELRGAAIAKMIEHPNIKCIKINWQKSNIEYHPFKRWVDLWSEE